jgi:hypothetical protein
MYAIGTIGGPVRLYIDGSYDEAVRQSHSGETVIECGNAAGAATMTASGTIQPVPPPVLTVAQVEAQLLDDIDDAREAQQMKLLTVGGAKKYVYSRKAVEVERSAGVVATLLDALSLTDRAAKYPYAAAEAALTGEKLSVVLARFTTGLKSSGQVEALEAKAQVAKRAVRAAKTSDAKRAAAKVNWSA